MPKSLVSGELTQGRSQERESYRLINEMRDVVQSVALLGPFFVDTTTAASSVIWTSENVPEGALWSVDVFVQGRATAARCFLHTSALYFRNTGGVTTQEGTSAIATIRTDANLTITNAVSGNKVTVAVADAAARAVSWAAWLEVRVSS